MSRLWRKMSNWIFHLGCYMRGILFHSLLWLELPFDQTTPDSVVRTPLLVSRCQSGRPEFPIFLTPIFYDQCERDLGGCKTTLGSPLTLRWNSLKPLKKQGSSVRVFGKHFQEELPLFLLQQQNHRGNNPWKKRGNCHKMLTFLNFFSWISAFFWQISGFKSSKIGWRVQRKESAFEKRDQSVMPQSAGHKMYMVCTRGRWRLRRDAFCSLNFAEPPTFLLIKTLARYVGWAGKLRVKVGTCLGRLGENQQQWLNDKYRDLMWKFSLMPSWCSMTWPDFCKNKSTGRLGWSQPTQLPAWTVREENKPSSLSLLAAEKVKCVCIYPIHSQPWRAISHYWA